MFKQRIKYLILGIFCFILGAALLQPALSILSDIYVTKAWEKRYLNKYYLNKHDADVRYYRKGVGDSRYVNTTSDTMSGTLTAGDYAYSSSKTRYLSVNGKSFNPLGDLEIQASAVNLGVYLTAGAYSYAVAPVNLPNGAIVTSFTTYYYDNDGGANWLQVQLLRESLSIASSGALGESPALGGSGTPGYASDTDSSISNATIDNNSYSYFAKAIMSNTNSNLTLKGVKIDYTVDAPQ